MKTLLLASLLLLVAVLPAAGTHPVLEAYGLPDDTPVDGLVLLRGPGDLPDGIRTSVLARRGGAVLATLGQGDADVLRASGWAITPLRDIPPRVAPMALKTWTTVTEVRPDIQAMVDAVTWTTVLRTMSKMVRINTRYSTTSGCLAASDTLQAYFTRLGLPTEKHAFQLSGSTVYNVVATKTGTVWPDSVFVICAHYDAISESSLTYTPGADDNATGTAAVMLAAQFLSAQPTACTVKFVCFAGEEQGLVGSSRWTADQAAAGAEFAGALNFDMIGWWTEGVHRELEVEVDPASQWLGLATINAANLYVPEMTCLLHVDAGAWWGDHASFWGQGYHAVNHEESWDWGDPDFNPNYHTTNDEILNLDVDFTVQNVKIAVAAIAMLADPFTTTSTPPPAAELRLTASPNPSSGHVAMRVEGWPVGTPTRVQVVDLRGRIVDESATAAVDGAATASWRPDPLRHPAGTYLLRLPDRPEVKPVRVSVIR